MTNTRPTLTPLGAAYEAHPEWTYSTIERAVYDRLGQFAPSKPTIISYHKALPKNVNIIVLTAIADVYGMTAKEAAPELTEHIDTSRDLLFKASGWTSENPADVLCSA